MPAAARPYPDLPASPDLPSIERGVLARWAEDDTFRASIDQRDGADAFVFYDGPPFANGLPHYGHLLTSFVKDAVPRYQTMRGRQVPRRFGWDCHGLPPEMEAEKELQLGGRAAIIEFGVERFNAHCAASVTRYTHEWRDYVTRAARWVDFADDYRTMDLSYMESVMWAFKTLFDKGLVYQGERVLPYCWECETPLSNFETRVDDAYRDAQDPAVTIAFTLTEPPVWAQGRTTRVVAWTTTPWTLPSNLALAVGPAIEYVAVEHISPDGTTELVVLGAGRVAAYAKELGEDPVVAHRLRGTELAGLAYTPLFPYFADQPNAFRVLTADYVADDDGTGIVHQAPGFGEDDMAVCKANGIGVVCPVDGRGCYTAQVTDFVGRQVFEANRDIIRRLTAEGALLREDSYVHSVPHCWRTDTQLIYKAVSSWFVEVTAVKDRLLANNQQITWTPAHIKDGSFGNWLEGARDWSISRNRFWGSPIPVWLSDDPAYPRVDVYGSLDDLERDFGVRPNDLHRPGIDQLTRPNPDDPTGQSTMRRVTDVLDCWFESGSMPFAQVHYPFENKEWFEDHFPADFIVEYNGQTRCWFYTLHVLATALFDEPAFRSCVAHGIVLGNDGRKLSKRLRNYPDPLETFERYGADAMRWSLLSSPALRGGNLIASEKQMGEALREAVLPLWNACSFFTTYANTASDGRRAVHRSSGTHVLDRYVLAKAAALVAEAEAAYDVHDLTGACAAIGAFLDALTNWYIRRSRDRFWAVGADPDAAAVDTLFTVLDVVLRVAAPVLPLTAEHLWTTLTGERSVHLTDWPDAAALTADAELVASMDLARDVCSAGHAIRKAQTPVLRTRLPLASLTVAHAEAPRLAALVDLIRDEVNVKAVELRDAIDAVGAEVLAVDARAAGPRLGGAVQAVLKAAKAGDWRETCDGVVVGGVALEPGEYTRKLVPADATTTRALPGDAGLVVLDITLTPELEAEGLARDVVRLVQAARKEAGLRVGDRIDLVLSTPSAAAAAAIRAHEATIANEVLAQTLTLSAAAPESGVELAGHGVLGIVVQPAR